MKAGTRRYQREAKTITAMVKIYCHGVHDSPTPCPACTALATYALTKLEKCPWGDKKPVCAQCPVHCYEKTMREQIRGVMRYAGPRMVQRHPLLTFFHLFQTIGRLGKRTPSRPGPKAHP